MQVFVSVAEQASFAGAARTLSLSPTQVTRAVAALEARIGAPLLRRTTRIVRLTEAGALYLQECKRILADIEAAEDIAASSQASVRGALHVTAPQLFGRLHVSPILLAFLHAHPHVSVRATFSDSMFDLLEQNIDVAVRIAALPDSGLQAIRVGSVRRVICASPAYLRKRGTPRSPSDLAQHEMIAFSGLTDSTGWRFAQDGKIDAIRVSGRLVVNAVDLALLAARAGEGLVYLLSYQVEADLRAGRLVRVLSEFELPPLPVQLVHREGREGAARVRAFIDLAVPRLRTVLQEIAQPSRGRKG